MIVTYEEYLLFILRDCTLLWVLWWGTVTYEQHLLLIIRKCTLPWVLVMMEIVTYEQYLFLRGGLYIQ